MGVSTNTLARWERGELRIANPRLVHLALERLELGAGPASTLTPVRQRSRAGIPDNNLPSPRTSFVGRRADQRIVRRLLSESRLVTLTGTAGIGKTRLALEVARSLVGRFVDGVCVVELASVADPLLVPHAVASLIHVSEQQDQPLLRTVAECLADRQLLLVLDNCEHLVPACRDLADAVLRTCPDVHILSTSRELLGLEDELTYRVMPLSVPDPVAISSVDQLSRWEASALFVARARHAVSDFALGPSSSSAVAQLCRRLDGLPLALELAAPLMRTLSPEQLLARLEDGQNLVVDGASSASHTRRLEEAIDSSYSLLTSAQQQLFNRLSVFAGGWTLEAAESVCVGDGIDIREVFPMLDALTTKSLIVVDRESTGGLRYRLLETLRAYAHRQLERSGELERVRDAHRAWMLEFGQEAETHLLDDSQGTWLDRLEREHDNARAALRWTMARGDSVAGLSLSAALWRFWYNRGHFTEGRGWLDQALALGDRTQACMNRVIVLGGAAIIATEQLDLRAAADLAEEALAMANELGNARWASTALMVFGNVARSKGDLEVARAHYEAALAMRRTLPHPGDMAVALGTLGHVALAEGDHTTARTLYTEALAIERALGQRKDMANILYRLGEVALDEGCYAEAREHFAESLTLAQEVGDRPRIAYVLEGFASLAAGAGACERVHTLEGAAAQLRQSIGGPLPGPEHDRLQQRLVHCHTRRSNASTYRALGLDEAIALALGTLASASDGSSLTRPGQLTPREVEVAQLIARGKSNREIAERLTVAHGTAQRHVANILLKLDLSSRAQIASWTASHGLLPADDIHARDNSVGALRV